MTAAVTEAPVLIAQPPPPVRRDRMVQVWLLTAALSWFGDALFAVALAWTAVHLVSPALAGLVVAVEMVPQALLVLVGGVLADRVDPRRLLVLGHVGRAAVLVVGTVLWPQVGPSPVVLVGVALSFGVIAGLTMPAGATLARQLVHVDDLATVSGWSQILGRLARLAGAPVGAVVVAQAGMGAAMLMDAVSFAAMAVLLLVVVRPRFRMPRSPHEGWRSSLGGGLSYLRRAPAARTLVVGICALNVFIGPVIGIGVALRVAHSGWAATWVGLAEAVFGAGAIAGSALAIRVRPAHLARAGFWVLVGQGVAIVAVAMPARAPLLAGMAGIGVAAGLASVWISTAYQRAVAVSHLGRVSSLNQLGDLLILPVTTPVFGALVSGVGVGSAIGIFGAAMTAMCLWFATRPLIRALT
ncbi:MFS transporter [Luteipulveratus sp. YIM 133132]|uniref:MFS transporter n=1 Tax=Luteipulveratus flavus TaxID=3031728 RepID=UPI0023B1DA0D|nr:MFS transporter [Luteipulveratus sp. YIM 133132]MDE9365244.1 MFS transporter [Luteipulveratus sp. YIM 133132]